MPIADPEPIADPTYWLEPEYFPAWRRRLELERRAGHLTLHRQKALHTLVALWRPGEPFQPTDDEVAAEAGISARTVRRARADAAELGLLSWTRTRQVVRGRWRQGRNVYDVRLPATVVCPDGQADRASQVSKKESKKADSKPSNLSDSEARRHAARQAAELLRDAGPVPDLLAARAKVLQERLIAEYAARHGCR